MNAPYREARDVGRSDAPAARRCVRWVVLGLALLGVCAVLGAWWIADRGQPDFSGIQEIRLSRGSRMPLKPETVTVTDKEQVAAMVAAVELRPKSRCRCAHQDSAVFLGPGKGIDVSLCEHCFDVGEQTYHMPKEFLRLYLSHFPPEPRKE